jgi:hypothetical protein
MYISPLIVLVPGPEAALLLATELDRTGGTSTCWMPLRAWSWALMRAAAAATVHVSDSEPWKDRDGRSARKAYRQRPRGRQEGIWSRRECRATETGDCARGPGRNQTCAPAENETGDQSGTVGVPARSDRSESASRCVARRRPLCWRLSASTICKGIGR